MTEPLKSEERAVLELRRLYRSYGYGPFKMSQFEPLSLYLHHKEFLISEGAITFPDTDGTLLALKPDVTLSIVKNYQPAQTPLRKVYYDENVYRVAGPGRGYREILQTGVECLGQVDLVQLAEVILLAARSLETISPRFVLDLSHLGFLSEILTPLALPAEQKAAALACLRQKNRDAMAALLSDCPADLAEPLLTLTTLSGPLEEVLPVLAPLAPTEAAQAALAELQSIAALLTPFRRQIRLDFSLVNDMSYYNGLVFRGYVEGIPTGVLSGGQYDQLLVRMGKAARGVGFAVYLDQLERLDRSPAEAEADTVLLYGPGADAAALFAAADRLRAQGQRVQLRQTAPEAGSVGRIVRLTGGEVTEVG